jgi:hypothetical protein
MYSVDHVFPSLSYSSTVSFRHCFALQM